MNKIIKLISTILAVIFGILFTAYQILGGAFGEGIVFGERLFNEFIMIPHFSMAVGSVISIILILKGKKQGYILLVSLTVIELVVFYGHRFGFWPCEYCAMGINVFD